MPRPTRLTGRLAGPALAATALALAACAALPDAATPPAPRDATTLAAARSFEAPAAAWPEQAWWHAYGDAQLDALVADGLAGSPSIAIAQARLARAESQVQTTRAAELPQLSANTSLTEQKQSNDYLSPRAATPQGWNDYGRATLDFSWEIDFWGRNRAALRAALSDAGAARADAAQARLMLATSIASAYAEFVRLSAAEDTAVAALEVRGKTVTLFRQRRDNGLETLAAVRQVEARREMAEADLLALREQIALQRNRLATLAGAGPDRGLALTRPTGDFTRAFGLPTTLPVDLVGRRPDLVAARLRVESAQGRIDAARAAFYPNVNLAAFIGVQSLGLDKLARGDSAVGSVGPAISLPIFEGGRLRGQLRGTQADFAAAVASYDDTLLRALQDVADVATSERALGAELARTSAGVDAAQEAWRIQARRYEGGLTSALDVLSAEDAWLANRRSLSDLQSRAFALDVALQRALGGGYAQAPAARS